VAVQEHNKAKVRAATRERIPTKSNRRCKQDQPTQRVDGQLSNRNLMGNSQAFLELAT